jgi:hypothetical protein
MPKGQLSRVMIRRLHLTDGAAPKHCQERAPHHDHHDAVGIVRSTQLSFPGAASGFMQEMVSIDPAKDPRRVPPLPPDSMGMDGRSPFDRERAPTRATAARLMSEALVSLFVHESV